MRSPRHPIPHIPAPHPPPPHPNDGPPAGWQTGKALPCPDVDAGRAAAGTLNCLARSVPAQVGQRGMSPAERTRVSKAWSHGSQRYSYIGIGSGSLAKVGAGRSQAGQDKTVAADRVGTLFWVESGPVVNVEGRVRP